MTYAPNLREGLAAAEARLEQLRAPAPGLPTPGGVRSPSPLPAQRLDPADARLLSAR